MKNEYFCINLNLKNLQINVIMVDKSSPEHYKPEQIDFWDVPVHAHYNFEFHYIYEGSAELEIDNTTYSLEKGKVYLVSPSVYHKTHSHTDKFSKISISFDFRENKHADTDCDKYSFYKAAFANTAPVTVIDVPEIYFDKIFECINDYITKGMMDTDLYRAVLTIIFDEIANRLNNIGPKNTRPLSLLKSDEYSESINRAKRIEDFIVGNLKRNITIEELANYMHLSVRHTKRFLDENMNISFKEFVHRYRMNTAKTLLHDGILSAKDVAAEVGYQSYIGFFKAFKAYTGETPEAYASRHNK